MIFHYGNADEFFVYPLRCIYGMWVTIFQVVEKSKELEAIWRIDALRAVLKEVHSLFVMFHGSIRALLDKEPAGGLIRTHLYYFIMDYLSGGVSFYAI